MTSVHSRKRQWTPCWNDCVHFVQRIQQLFFERLKQSEKLKRQCYYLFCFFSVLPVPSEELFFEDGKPATFVLRSLVSFTLVNRSNEHY